MNKILPTLLGLLLLAGAFVPVVYSQGEEATVSGVNTDTIKENVKKRIEEVVQNKTVETPSRKALAYMGILEDRANNTLSIQTSDGVKMASASANVTTVRLPDNEDIGLADVGLGEYVMALGYLNTEDVLTTHRLLVSEDPPASPDNQIFFGIITNVTDDFITLRNPASNQEQELFLSRNSEISLLANGTKEEMAAEDIPLQFNALVVYEPASESVNDADTVLELLIRSGNPEEASVPASTHSASLN